jgi:hypothetical protein
MILVGAMLGVTFCRPAWWRVHLRENKTGGAIRFTAAAPFWYQSPPAFSDFFSRRAFAQ